MGGIVSESTGHTSAAELAYFQNVLAWEEGPFVTQRGWFEHRGVEFASPDNLSGVEMEKELWRLIAALAGARVYISYTNHLSDAELYRKLWHEVLADKVPDRARNPMERLHWDFSDAGESDPVAWLSFYASEDERKAWLAQCPGTALPARRQPAFDRDQLLPAM
jgi:hypothetical protein